MDTDSSNVDDDDDDGKDDPRPYRHRYWMGKLDHFQNIQTSGEPNSVPPFYNNDLPQHLRYQYSFEIPESKPFLFIASTYFEGRGTYLVIAS